jgi:hydrogenase maturation protein HypF
VKSRDVRADRVGLADRVDRAVHVAIFGVVQGVGFRPFVYRLARRLGLAGWVRNSGAGVDIHIEANDAAAIEAFLRGLIEELPPLARIERQSLRAAPFRSFKEFTVRKSGKGGRFVFISPDIATCSACLRDIEDPADRRFGYPFTNCTDCGPRYTIVRALPYDRPNTTMAGFPMCPDCAGEYRDPGDRRYHAQPVACPRCGPRIEIRKAKSGRTVPGGIPRAVELLRKGKILAVKGLGGFHLSCDPLSEAAVARLRRIKARRTKPLALMARDAAVVRRYAHLSPDEEALLVSDRRPIVLLRKKKDIAGIAPNLDEIGFMLPYTPLHHLLLRDLGLIVATSSNRKDSPIMKEEEEGIRGLCDYILTHNRPIAMRADDSVAKIAAGAPLFIRRARGYVPYPQRVPDALCSPLTILALGGELKDTVSLYKDGYIITSQFLGDLDEYGNHLYFEETIRHLTGLFDADPACVVSDLHPGFHTTRFAEKSGLPHLRVQHHHAHVLAAMVEHGLSPDARVLGVAWDGYGYGADGTAWGGEFLLAGYGAFERFAHFEPVPLPGGDLAAKQPWRMALAYLRFAGADPRLRPGTLRGVGRARIRGVLEMLNRGVRSPLSTSCGRLFDAVAALTGLAPLENEYEAEAAMRLEAAAAAGSPRPYGFDLERGPGPLRISVAPAIRGILADLARGVKPGRIAARFQSTLVRVVATVAGEARVVSGIGTVVLSGGVFLNKKLTEAATGALLKAGFEVLRPVQYSPNDESLSVGQIAHALARMMGGRPPIS